MKPTPFLLLAALLFWGWQSGFLLAGAILGVILESARWVKLRWDLEDTDFRRTWGFCALLTVALAGYVFSLNEAGGGMSGLVHGRIASFANSTSVNTVQTASSVMRWLPMTLFLFVAAQRFSVRGQVPVSAITFIPRSWRWPRRDASEAERYVSVGYAYFIVCLFSAGIHLNDGTHTYFWGLMVLLAWGLWSLRAPRFGWATWLVALVAVGGVGFLGQAGIGQAQQMIENYNAQWLARFFRPRTDAAQSVTSLGQLGELKLSSRIVIRMEPQVGQPAPDYLREASYRNYHAQKRTWSAIGARGDFDNLFPETDNQTWILLPAKTNASIASIACYLDGWSQEVGAPEGLLPLPSGCFRLDHLPVLSLKKNKVGAVLATGLGLVIFDAHYGRGATLDAPPDASTNQFDLVVPDEEAPALDRVMAEMPLTATNDAAKILAAEIFFRNNFTYSTWQGPDKLATTNATPLTRFLLTSRSGHCEYFATATVLLLRRLHIPARYATGYFVHETSGSGFVVRERDAHAWCLAWNNQTKTWDDVDTTPGSWVAVEGDRASIGEWISDLGSWLGFQFAKFRWGQSHIRQYLLWALLPAMVVLLFHILFRRRRQRTKSAMVKSSGPPVTQPGLDSEFYQLERKLAARLPRQPGEPLSAWLERALAEPALTDLRPPARSLLPLHYRLRFDPEGLPGEQRKILAEQVRAVLGKLAQK